MAVLKVRQRGQLTLPKEIRSLLNIEENGNLFATVQGNSIVLTPLPKTTGDVDDLIGILPPKKGINLTEAKNDAWRQRADSRCQSL